MTLSNAKPGNEVTLKCIGGGRRLKSRLYSLGLIPGTKVCVIQGREHGRILIRVRDGSLALGHGMAEKIQVEQIHSE